MEHDPYMDAVPHSILKIESMMTHQFRMEHRYSQDAVPFHVTPHTVSTGGYPPYPLSILIKN